MAVKSSMVIIENRTERPLTDSINQILRLMFSGYRRLVVKSEFTDGLSDSRVFLIRGIRPDAAELPAVVKIDHVERIQQEYEAYKRYIHNRLPRVARINGEPVYPPGGLEGGLQYELVGSGSFDIASFYAYCQQAETGDIGYVLEAQLFRSLHALWKQRTVEPEFHLQTYYDAFLPPDLSLEYIPSFSAVPSLLEPETIHAQSASRDDLVQVTGFVVQRVAKHAARLMLNMPSDIAASYRIEISGVPQVETFTVGQILHQPLAGQVIQSRSAYLRAEVAAVLGPGVDLSAATLTLADGSTLPNPLVALPQLLNQTLDEAYIASIHGDLNLQNILVEPQNRNAYLIDFYKSRRDHVLRDLLHLEMAVTTRLIPESLGKERPTPQRLLLFYERLHCALLSGSEAVPPVGLEKPFAILRTIRQAAHRYLFERDQWAEYQYGLIFYLLGALKFADLNRIAGAKEIAFWGAAVTLKLLQSPPPCQEIAIGMESRGKGISLEELPAPETIELAKPRPSHRDTFSGYEMGLERLLAQMGQGHERYADALLFEQRLAENIGRARRMGDTSTRRSERTEIIDRLNELALAVTGRSFNELSREDESHGR
jgi:hypothetical protein